MKFIKILFFVVFALFATGCRQSPEITFENGWVRAMPPGARMSAAYGTVTNQSDAVIELTAFRSDSFASVSLHRTEVQDGVSKMKPQGASLLDEGESLTLEPGGLHLMLMGPLRPLAEDDVVELMLITADGAEFHFTLPVSAR